MTKDEWIKQLEYEILDSYIYSDPEDGPVCVFCRSYMHYTKQKDKHDKDCIVQQILDRNKNV